ncbi:MAG TPA: glycosyltransferase family protein [archaeon]|jgi:uncharacterized protein (TIGR00661 family)|nr:glycosyltransferase family protein [archaeon]
MTKSYKIVYAINADGFGHVTRSIPIIDHLLHKKHNIEIITDKKVADFLQHKYKQLKIHIVPQVYFEYTNDSVKAFKSFFKCFNKHNFNNLKKATLLIKKIKPDIVISDLERYSLWGGKFLELPTIEIDNHATIFRGDVEFKQKDAADFLQAKSVSKFVYPFANFYFGLCFYRTQITKKNTEVFDPIFLDDIKKYKAKDGDYILVYNRFMDKAKMVPTLKKIKNQKFVIFGYNVNKIDENLEFRKAKPNLFKEIAESKAIITNGGHTLITEAIYFKKPIYSIPIKHQFEQLTNAYYLEKLEYGLSTKKIDAINLRRFIKNIPYYKTKLEKHKYQDKKYFLKRLDEKINELITESKTKL